MKDYYENDCGYLDLPFPICMWRRFRRCVYTSQVHHVYRTSIAPVRNDGTERTAVPKLPDYGRCAVICHFDLTIFALACFFVAIVSP